MTSGLPEGGGESIPQFQRYTDSEYKSFLSDDSAAKEAFCRKEVYNISLVRGVLERGGSLRIETGSGCVILSRSARGDTRYQASEFDRLMRPSGHIPFDSAAELFGKSDYSSGIISAVVYPEPVKDFPRNCAARPLGHALDFSQAGGNKEKETLYEKN